MQKHVTAKQETWKNTDSFVPCSHKRDIKLFIPIYVHVTWVKRESCKRFVQVMISWFSMEIALIGKVRATIVSGGYSCNNGQIHFY